ncbi:MAG: cytochrome b/b6 domain-containing protein, partial [Microcoleus sp. SIO2G3]|nr:cytochrome b/b6 domain-containing protein [Microcoleus sp. SIO2G3]
TGLFAIAAMLTAYWTYDTYDGRWGKIPLPHFPEIEGIHGTFGLYALLIFPLFALYAFGRGQQRLIQPDSLATLRKVNRPIWWLTLHRFSNTLAIVGLTFALFSGKMMSSEWLPRGELNHGWYYAHLISWLVMLGAIALHLLMSAKVGGVPLLMSMLNWRWRDRDSPKLWPQQVKRWRQQIRWSAIATWLRPTSALKLLEIFVVASIIAAWVISAFKA